MTAVHVLLSSSSLTFEIHEYARGSWLSVDKMGDFDTVRGLVEIVVLCDGFLSQLATFKSEDVAAIIFESFFIIFHDSSNEDLLPCKYMLNICRWQTH